MRGPGTLVLAAVFLPLALSAASTASEVELEKFFLTDGREFIGTYSAAEGVMTISTVNGTMSFALTAGDIASHRHADAAELAALTAAPEASVQPAADAATSDAAKAEARLTKFTAITGLKDYPTLTAAQRTTVLTKLPERLLGSWRVVDLVGEAPDQERARLVHLEVDGIANFSADIDLYHRAAPGRALPSAAPAAGAPGAGAAGARAAAPRPLASRYILKAFSCGGGAAPSYLVTNDASGAVGALITCGANDTVVVSTMTRTPFTVNSQDCTVYRVVK
jgi:hypothetical protein